MGRFAANLEKQRAQREAEAGKQPAKRTKLQPAKRKPGPLGRDRLKAGKPLPNATPAAQDGLRAQIEADLAELSGKSGAEKAQIKAGRLPVYRPALADWRKGADIDGLVLSVVAVWLFDLGEIGEFLEVTREAETRGPLFQHPKFSDKTWDQLRLWLLKDWAFERRDARESWEPYVTEEYARIEDPGALPDALRDGLEYLVFYGLALGDQLEAAAEFGRKLLDSGRNPGIKGSLGRLEKLLAQNKPARFDFAGLDFKAS